MMNSTDNEYKLLLSGRFLPSSGPTQLVFRGLPAKINFLPVIQSSNSTIHSDPLTYPS